jgi:hemerythrin-like domain-containing protein
MTTIYESMSSDHRRCDDLFAAAEQAAGAGDWEAAAADFNAFREATERHFAMEEGVLFPDFEQRTGQDMGPCAVMRMEHQQMRGMFQAMGEAVDAKDKDAYLGHADTLMVYMQQHNLKEEQMLYPMMDQVFGAESDDLLSQAAETVDS